MQLMRTSPGGTTCPRSYFEMRLWVLTLPETYQLD